MANLTDFRRSPLGGGGLGGVADPDQETLVKTLLLLPGLAEQPAIAPPEVPPGGWQRPLPTFPLRFIMRPRPTEKDRDEMLRRYEQRLPPPMREPIGAAPGPSDLLEQLERESPELYRKIRERRRWFFSG